MALTLWLTGQGRGLLHAVIYMLGVLPGIPIGIRLFGKRHPAAWIAGALLGYGLLQLAIWATIESRLSSGWEFVAVWIVLGALTTVVARGIGINARHRDANVDASRYDRAVSGAAAGPSAHDRALRQPRPRGRGGQSLLPRLLHRRLPLAQRTRVRAGQVLTAAAQSISRAAGDELLLDLLPAAEHRGGACCRPRRPASSTFSAR